MTALSSTPPDLDPVADRDPAWATAHAVTAVAEDLAGEFSLRPLLERILLRCTELLDCDAGSVCSVDDAHRGDDRSGRGATRADLVHPVRAAEIIGTFILMFTILAVIHRKAVPGFAGLSIGFIVFAIIAVGSASGGAINPARYVGPFLLEAIFGHDGAVKLAQFPIYIISEFLGALLAAGAYIVVFRAPADGHSETAEVEAVSAA